MQSKQTMKRLGLVALLALILATASSTMAAPPVLEPESVVCGDSITCSTAGNAVYVENIGTGPTIYGRNTSTGEGLKGRGNPGVYGFSYHAAGVRGKSNAGVGVKGESVDKYGVSATSVNGYAVYAISQEYRGGYFESAGDAYPDLVLGGNSATVDNGTIRSAPDDSDSDLVFYGNDKVHIHLDEDNNTAGSNFQVFSGGGTILFEVGEDDITRAGNILLREHLQIGQDSSYGSIQSYGTSGSELYLFANGNIYADLDQNDDESGQCFYIRDGSNTTIWSACESKGVTVDGSVAAAVETGSGSREMYAVSSPENWFEDYGSAELVEGKARVEIDALFAETVNLDVEYQVYLTPISSEAVLLFVTEKTAGAFTVEGVTLDGQPASAGFDYRIVAKRLGYETQRLEAVAPAAEAEADR